MGSRVNLSGRVHRVLILLQKLPKVTPQKNIRQPLQLLVLSHEKYMSNGTCIVYCAPLINSGAMYWESYLLRNKKLHRRYALLDNDTMGNEGWLLSELSKRHP